MSLISKLAIIGATHELLIAPAYQADGSVVVTIFVKDPKEPNKALPPVQYSGSIDEVESRIESTLAEDLKIFPKLAADLTSLADKKKKLEDEIAALERKAESKKSVAAVSTTGKTTPAKAANAKAQPTKVKPEPELAPPAPKPDGVRPTSTEGPDLFSSSPFATEPAATATTS